ncbi:DUF397 domain-containing protein [Kitasatospora sp. NPDC057940]|uniref:DUF397 domain-containing protein n=1 Tax=Kitasatospora sp. NPDC057940 TaxID=3346285 RepID=UPI0036DC5E13
MTTEPQWFKFSYSSNGGNCVEVARNLMTDGIVPVRDSRDPQSPALTFPADAFTSFITAVQAGEFGEFGEV